jgi:hypothetical protein
MQQILNIAKGKWKPDVHHHRQADDLGAGLEIPKRGAFCHGRTLPPRLARLKAVSSDRSNLAASMRDYCTGVLTDCRGNADWSE